VQFADVDVSAANIEPLSKRKCSYIIIIIIIIIIIRDLIKSANKTMCSLADRRDYAAMRQCFIDIILIIIIIIIIAGALSAYKLVNLEDVGVDVRILLKWVLEKYVG
jgi:hypothetical protein